MLYNVVSQVFHTKEVCSRFSSSNMHFIRKRSLCVLQPPLGGLFPLSEGLKKTLSWVTQDVKNSTCFSSTCNSSHDDDDLQSGADIAFCDFDANNNCFDLLPTS